MRGILDQRSDQPQQLLVFWPASTVSEKRSDFDLRAFAPGCRIGIVHDEHLPGLNVAGEVPAVSIGTLIKLSGLNGHASLRSMPAAKRTGAWARGRYLAELSIKIQN